MAQEEQRALVLPPTSRLGAIAPAERSAALAASPVKGRYERTVDRASAFEALQGRAQPGTGGTGSWQRPEGLPTRRSAEPPGGRPDAPEPRGRVPRQEKSTVEKIILGDGRRQGMAEAMAKSVVRQIGSSLGRQIVRGVLGSIFKG